METKSELAYFTCGDPWNFAKECPEQANCDEKKLNAVTGSNTYDWCGNLPSVLSSISISMLVD